MHTMTVDEGLAALTGLIDAAQREPLILQRQARDVAVVLSMTEYERLTRRNVAEFQRFCDQIGERIATDMDEHKLAQLLAPED
jgi:PHD/YefM family antitoxin component YafN of YafNO toxin-antitoxin module